MRLVQDVSWTTDDDAYSLKWEGDCKGDFYKLDKDGHWVFVKTDKVKFWIPIEDTETSGFNLTNYPPLGPP
ncbi:hypothetical protein DRO97_10060 [Archaeoglobales archaeon]|nr:MAG: hypothetical protein DRO97_10060 [Archaeoglobales archaeon]